MWIRDFGEPFWVTPLWLIFLFYLHGGVFGDGSLMVIFKLGDWLGGLTFLPNGDLVGLRMFEGVSQLVRWSIPSMAETIFNKGGFGPRAFRSELAPVQIQSDVAGRTFAISHFPFFLFRDEKPLSLMDWRGSTRPYVVLSADGKCALVKLQTWLPERYQFAKYQVNDTIYSLTPVPETLERTPIGFLANDRDYLEYSTRTQELSRSEFFGHLTEPILKYPMPDIYGVRYSPDRSQMLIRSTRLYTLPTDAPEKIDLVKGESTIKNINSAAFHPDNRRLFLSNTKNERIQIFDLQHKQITEQYDWRCGLLSSVDVSHDGLLGACSTEKGELILWDID